MKCERIALAPAPLPADNNIRHQYPIHKGKWIRHPEAHAGAASFCRYTLSFELATEATIHLHVSADQRFELYCDEAYVGMGPDRSDVEHWSFHTYRLSLIAGRHELRAEVYFLGLGAADRPWAQTTIEPGFVLFSEDAPVDLNTGTAPWKVSTLNGISMQRVNLRAFMVVGPDYTIDSKTYFNVPPAVDPIIVRAAGDQCETGKINPGPKLYPSRMPEQLRQPVGGGRIRCVCDVDDEAPLPDRDSADAPVPASSWQALIDGRSPVKIPARTRLVVLWDLEQYHTAYPQLTTLNGAGASVRIQWAESCFVHPRDAEGNLHIHKANRNEIAGKYFRGNGDTFLPDGPQRVLRSFWWRAGRYVRITVQTGEEPLTIQKIELLESRMALENQSKFSSSDAMLEPIVGLAVRGIQMCAHETYMDCPYYEQMMYTGDTRLQMLVSYVMSEEDRLNQRTLELFDWSRQETGFVHERYPSQPKQLSCTFAMIWVLMLRDYLWWRDDASFMRHRVKGMRCLLEEFKALPDAHAPLLGALPGWSFMDWVDGLSFVNHPGPKASCSAVTNLLFINAILAAAQVEEAIGEEHLARYNRDWAARMARAVEERFWVEKRGLFADDLEQTQFSEHAQCLALLSGLYPHREARCFESLITAEDLRRTTVYFSHYLLEAFAKFGRGDLIQEKLEFWKQMSAIGMRTPMEKPEPSRSDCHAWGSHPLYHMHASLAGIRPDAPGFSDVRIAPLTGSLSQLSSTIPHPRGKVSLSMSRTGEIWRTRVALPEGVQGTLVWRGQSHAIRGAMSLDLTD